MPTRLRIRELLRARGLSGYALAKLSGTRLSLSTASRLARGEQRALRPETIDVLCELLHCEPGDLYHRTKR